MFCPRCSEFQPSDEVRFCKRCGFRLEAIHDLITPDAPLQSQTEGALPKQKEISIGAGLMFIGSVVGMLWAEAHRGGDADVLPQVYLILGFTLGFILLLFHPLLNGLKRVFSKAGETGDQAKEETKGQSTKQREGINLGALLMFLGTIKAMAIATFTPDLGQRPLLTIEIATGMLLLLLVIRWLVAGVYRLFFESSAAPQKAQAERVTSDLQAAPAQAASDSALPPSRHHTFNPVERGISESVEMAQPASITENTTSLLDKK